MTAILDLSIISGPLVIAVYVVAGLAVALLIAVRPSRRWPRRRWLVVAGLAAVAGAAIGLVATWLASDVANLFGVELSAVVHTWIAVGFAGMAIAIASFVRATWRRVIASALALLLFAATTAMSVNIDIGQYPTVRSALGLSVYQDNPLPQIATPPSGAERSTIATWTAPDDLPEKGVVGEIEIPATVSGFPARPADVYLPPAALTANPPLLPVLIVMSGQPGNPDAPLSAAKLQQSLDAYAAQHQGLAPIVVSPDQLGSPDANPMCIDSPLGNSATYLTVDVPTWIRANLPVLDSPQYWGVGGLSQGGTCSIQLGAAHPELFSAILDASGELGPSLGDQQKTIDQGFGGDQAAYEAAMPAAIMAAKAPYTDMFAVFGVGANDSGFMPGVQTLYQDALAAGIDAVYIEAPNSAHDATAWAYTFQQGLGLIADRWGLNR
jgi:enterochelin esterase-like enzyme